MARRIEEAEKNVKAANFMSIKPLLPTGSPPLLEVF
jgi:hypothetical protein